MRKILLFVAAVLIISACTSIERKAQKVVDHKIKDSLSKIAGYKPVTNQFDSSFSTFFGTEQYKVLMDSSNYYWNLYHEYTDKRSSLSDDLTKNWDLYKTYSDSSRIYLNKYSNFSDKIRECSEAFQGVHNGWGITHAYLKEDGIGTLIRDTTIFQLNLDATEITSYFNVGETTRIFDSIRLHYISL